MTVKRLGKGLSAIIPEVPDNLLLDYRITEIAITRIRANPHQPRKRFDAQTMTELKNSIKDNGIIQPITVRQKDDDFELIAGERRLRACQELGLKTIPAYVLPVKSDIEMMELAIIENVQREDLNPVEEAEAYQILSGAFSLSHEQIAAKVGKERSTITNKLRLLNLPEEILNDLRSLELSAGHARPLLTLASRQQQLNLWHRIQRDGLSVRQVEALAKKMADATSTEPKSRPAGRKTAALKSLEASLMHLLGTRVRIKGTSVKGRIEIDFYSPDDLNRLVELIARIEDTEQ
jgi:ParB family chromosome partitioning protein